MIPKKIFQTWKTKKISKNLQKIINTWKINNPEYQYYFYDDHECEIFIRKFDKKIFSAYKRIVPGAFKIDLWRACVLYEFGGFYCDIDTLCLGKIDKFVNFNTQFIAPIDLNLNCKTGHNLFNSFIGANAKSEVLKFCIERIIYNVENNLINVPALDFSSCGVLGRAVNNYLDLNETSSFIGKEGEQKNIHLLKFEKDGEYVKDNKGNILFQNKNGNKKIKEIYEKECEINNISSWSNSKSWLYNKIFL
jgi:mannosyltransferase OCH1-like enzyme